MKKGKNHYMRVLRESSKKNGGKLLLNQCKTIPY